MLASKEKQEQVVRDFNQAQLTPEPPEVQPPSLPQHQPSAQASPAPSSGRVLLGVWDPKGQETYEQFVDRAIANLEASKAT